jgi:uncharacterized RDD family membrane protein YckC
MNPSEPAPAPPGATPQPPAGLWRRLAANLYDALLLVAIWMCGGLVVVLLRGEAVPPLTWWFEAYLLALAFGYFGWSWVRGGQTAGMRAWRIRVLRADGSPIDWGPAAIRFVAGSLVVAALAFGAWAVRGAGPGTVAGAIGLALGAAAIGWMFVDGRRRTWFDLAAGTVVVVAPGKT